MPMNIIILSVNIPFQADSASEFFHRMRRGLACSYSNPDSCQNLVGKFWLFMTGYTFGNLFQYLLIQYAEGAVYACVVQALIAPSVTLFWTLFKYDQRADTFGWNPHFNKTTAFTLAGLCIMIPGVVLYNYFSNIEVRQDKEKLVINVST